MARSIPQDPSTDGPEGEPLADAPIVEEHVTTPPETDPPTTDDSGPIVPPPTDPADVPPTPSSEAARILGAESADLVLRQHWNDADGKAHSPGDTVTVDAATALTLLATKWATRAESTEESGPAEGDSPS